ncbi:hypothetical protein [Alicyclobacillus mengziensis]|uniref:Uncharacterized protein n=1 Tax=Alicyclobacillus mengziensis TaxID=2931921 RepID=A0A9X7Z5P4_9BACL|nr:hypothetical protein [Alicyclobacillus mengziensis]QSO45481.1 hypothetical protein JZ786_12945 [Alicyclobacillus mengziensis]
MPADKQQLDRIKNLLTQLVENVASLRIEMANFRAEMSSQPKKLEGTSLDEQLLRKVFGEMLKPIEDRLNRIEFEQKSVREEMTQRFDVVDQRLTDIQTQLNTVENRIITLNDNLRLTIRQTSADAGEIRIELAKIKEKVGLQ